MTNAATDTLMMRVDKRSRNPGAGMGVPRSASVGERSIVLNWMTGRMMAADPSSQDAP